MTTQIDSLQPGYHVRSALEALFNDRADGPQVLRRTPDTVAASDFAGADIVVMANVPELTDDRLLALENRVKDGAGLLLFLGPASQSDFYNKHLHRPSRPDMSLLPAPLAGVASGRLASLTRLDWTHPLLAPFSDPVLSDLTRVRASAYYRFATQPRTDATQILSRFEDGTPAAMEHLLGAGRVLVFNTTANDEWSDLPRRASFLPLLDRVLHRIAFSKHGRQFSAGEPVLLRVPALGENTRVSIAGPSGRSVSFAREGDGARSFIRVEEAEPAGVYAVRASGETGDFETSFIVHSGLDDARCLRMDPETLRLWWNGASFKITQPDVKNDTPNPPTAERVFLWPFLLAAAAFLLMAEMHLVHRLTPAMNPALVGSTVAQHGLFRTVSPKEARP
jgi:hypothetical protein